MSGDNAAPKCDVDSVMEQAQVFASAWSLVGGPYDNGDGMESAKSEKTELRRMIEALSAKLGRQEVTTKNSVTVSAKILREALEFANPDGPENEDQEETEIVLEWMPERTSIDNEPMAAGYYAYFLEYPEEGVYGPLGEPIAPTEDSANG